MAIAVDNLPGRTGGEARQAVILDPPANDADAARLRALCADPG